MPVVIRLFKIEGSALATGREGLAAKAVAELRAGHEPERAEYLKAFDCEAHDGRGDATFTRKLKHAKRFADRGEAFEFWRQQSKTRPLRADGEPNRPLCAFNVTFEEVP